MICVSIQNKNLEEIFDILDTVEMAEIRLDRCELSDEDIDLLFSSSDVPLIATCRLSECDEKEAEKKLKIAIEAGAKYADLEIEAPAPIGKRIRRACLDSGTIFIRSFHDFNGTPDIETLSAVLSDCRKFGGELVKIVTTANCAKDWETVSKLYGNDLEGRIVAFCMGEAGKQSRIECLKMGAPFTYTAISEEDCTAPGQWSAEAAYKELYGEYEAYENGPVRIAASKSFAQRAIIAAALAEGTSHLGGYSPCSDSEGAIEVARELGAKVSKDGSTLTITGIGGTGKLALKELHTRESGLLTRLMIPVMSMISDTPVRITGEGTLLKRPLAGANDIMAAFGVMLTNASEHPGSKEVFIPADISGHLLPGRAEISGKGGSQLISGLLMALPLADENSVIYVQDPRSIPYMFITMDVLKKFGVKIGNEMEGDDEFLETQDWAHCSGMTFKIKGGQSYKAADFDIEGDWSGAANFMVAGAVFGNVCLSGLDSSSLQADLSIMDILVEAGASISQDEDGNINVFKAPLNAFATDLNNAPDLFPIVAILAAFCPGQSRIDGVGRLIGKESNRAEAIIEALTQLGVKASTEGDQMIIEGHSLSWRLANGQMLNAGDYTSRHDHRMVMALKVAELGANGPITIDDTDCVGKSYPDFLESFKTA